MRRVRGGLGPTDSGEECMLMKLGATLAVGFDGVKLPYLYQGDLDGSLAAVAAAGFESVDLLVRDPSAFTAADLRKKLQWNGLTLAALGTGGAWIAAQLHLCSPEAYIRESAEQYVRQVIDLAGDSGTVAILGLVTGILEQDVTREQATEWLAPALNRLGEYAASRNAGLVIEPLNRYESNFVNTFADGLQLIGALDVQNVGLLADLFHMNIEEASVAGSIREAAGRVGHVHFADSNRRAPGMGHTDFAPIAAAFQEVGYSGCVSVEVFPVPDADSATRQAVAAYKEVFRESCSGDVGS